MPEELGIDPRWRWDEIVRYTKKAFELNFDVDFTNLYYETVIVPSYIEDRHYHTLRHIEYLLKHVHDFSYESHQDRNLLKWAIWFHDIVYDPKRDDNEIRSANFMKNFMRAIEMNEEHIETMKWLILVTTHKGSPQTYLEDIICDLDLREFTSDRQYKNAEEVRKEFAHLSDEEYDKGRKVFIKSMLDKEYIYHTDLYRETLESTARHNLQREMESIKQY